MIALDDGPFFIFKRVRYWLKDRAYWEALSAGMVDDKAKNGIDDKHFGKWHNLSEGLSCPFCAGVWVSLPLLALLIWPTVYGDWFLVLLSISGAQAYLQTQDKK